MLTVDEFNSRMQTELESFLRNTVRLIDEFNEENEIGAVNRTQVLLFTTLSSCRFILGHTYNLADSYMEDILSQAKKIREELKTDAD